MKVEKTLTWWKEQRLKFKDEYVDYCDIDSLLKRLAEENQLEPEKDLGCVLSGIDGNCIKLNLVCSGTREERHKCPLWGYVTMADYRLIRKKE